MKIDTFVQLIKDLRTNSINDDDTDPNNILLQTYQSPYDNVYFSESVRYFKLTNGVVRVWGDGTTYTLYDSNGDPWQMASCNWLWGAGGRWG